MTRSGTNYVLANLKAISQGSTTEVCGKGKVQNKFICVHTKKLFPPLTLAMSEAIKDSYTGLLV